MYNMLIMPIGGEKKRENIKTKVVAVVEQCGYGYSVLYFF